MRTALVAFVMVCVSFPALTHAQASETETVEKAKVVSVTDQRTEIPPGTSAPSQVQTLTAHVLEGRDNGRVITFDNDFTQLSVGDLFYLRHSYGDSGVDYYAVADPYRLNVLYALGFAFLVLVFLFGGMQGVRGLASLAGSLVLIFYLLLPGILAGYSPVLMSIGVASLIIIAGSYITHGFNRTTSAAVFGMIATVIITGLLAYWVVHAGQFSGYDSDYTTDLHFGTNGSINLLGLLLGGILIGLLGVLYDISIGQAIAVEELAQVGKHLTRWEVYRRAIRIGREHIGALINTLAIAYVGTALPLLLLFKLSSGASAGFIVNGEIFASEIVRILIGSIGLILAVPITTLISVYLISSDDR